MCWSQTALLRAKKVSTSVVAFFFHRSAGFGQQGGSSTIFCMFCHVVRTIIIFTSCYVILFCFFVLLHRTGTGNAWNKTRARTIHITVAHAPSVTTPLHRYTSKCVHQQCHPPFFWFSWRLCCDCDAACGSVSANRLPSF